MQLFYARCKKSAGRLVKKSLTAVAVAIALSAFFPATALAGTGATINGVDDISTFSVPRSLDIQPVTIDDDVTISSSASFADGYLYIKPTSASSGDVLSIKSASNPNAYNAVSISGTTVYMGTGSSKKAIGSIDATYNGTDGKGLKINFSTPLPNGGFEEGYTTWSFHDSRYNMSGDSGKTAGTKYGFMNLFTAYERYDTTVKTYGGAEGSKYLYLSISGITDPKGTQHGPWVESAAFSAKKGDSISLYFSAKNTGDKYDVYGYLVDKSTNAKQLLFYERGDSTGGWKQVTSAITLPSSDNFAFQFICGSQDGTGGMVISSELNVDGVKVIKNEVDAQILTQIARNVQLTQVSSGSQRPATQDRNYTFEIKDSNGNMASASKATVHINTWPGTPIVSASPAAGTTDTLNVGYSSENASTYDVYLDGALMEDNVTATTCSYSGFGINTQHEIKIISTNTMGDSDAGIANKYTNAQSVSIASVLSTTNSVTLTINNAGNPEGTAYCVERSADGVSGWSVVRDFDVSSVAGETTSATDSSNLAPNTLYYYRVKARNGDGVATGYSNVFSWYTGPAAPNPLSVTPKTGTTDTLDLTWGSPSGAVNYDVYMDGARVGEKLTANSMSQSGLAPNTEHAFYVVARNATDGTSLASSTVSAYTNAAVPIIQLDSATTGTIYMSILNNGNPEGTLYQLQRSIDDVNYTTMEDFTLESTGEETTPYIDRNLDSGTAYYYRMKAKNEDGADTVYSEAASKITLPVAPSGVTVEARTGEAGALIVRWTAPRGAQSFDVYRKGEGETVFALSEGGVTGTSVEQLGLTPNRQYTYYVVAKNASGESAASSNEAAYTNAAIPGISSSNSGDTNNLTILNKGNPKTLSTENSSGTEYYVEYTTDGDEIAEKTWTPLSEYWITYLSPQHSAVDSGKTYAYRVKARNSDGVETDFSDLASARSNEAPVVAITSPTQNTCLSEVSGYTRFALSGTVSDADGDLVTLSASVNGVERSVTVRATATDIPWTLSWDIVKDNIAESNYSDIAVEATDDYGGDTLTSWTYLLTVDKTNPQAPAIMAEDDWTGASSVPVVITDGTDLDAGADHTEYSLTGATVQGWTAYAPFDISNAGITTIYARTVDKVGNVGPQQTAQVKIDRTAPQEPTLSLESTSGESGCTSGVLINIINISASDPAPGSGDGSGNMTAQEMMISNDSDFDGAVWEDFGTSRSGWSLVNSDDGVHTVYIKFRDAVGNVSETAQADIVMDDTPPTISISQPSSFNAKKGSSVTYSISLDEESTVIGMDNSGSSKIELSYAGDFSVEDQEAIWDALTFEKVDATHYKVTINLPGDIASDGMIGFKVKAGVACDALGNLSMETPANASFAVDASAPANQDELFTADLTVQGGQAVTLAKTSQSCDGGYDSDSVRFAPLGYTGEDPANAQTITSTHGKSSVINAPTQEGNYYLYIIDAAGNISAASTHMLTVKNDGPSVTITGDAKWVKASASVDYLITYSVDTDVDTINLTQQKISLVTTGTANAYVTISEVPGEPYQRRVTLANLLGDGTISIKVAPGTGEDIYGNPALESNVSEPVTVDNIAPVVSTTGLASDNANDVSAAKVGDKLTLDFTTNEEVVVPEVTIQGVSVTPAAMNAEMTSWRAELTVTAGEPFESAEGQAAVFSIVALDKVANQSDTVTQADAAQSVTYDFHAPVVTVAGENGLDLDALGKYKEGVVITFNEGSALLDGTMEIVSGTTIYDAGSHTVVVTDTAGQSSSEPFEICYDSLILEQDKDALTIGYAQGDSADSVTRDVTLLGTTDSAATVNWVSGDGAVNAATGVVTRPAAGAGDADVVLTATIAKNGYTQTKVFNVKVVEAAGSEDGLDKVEDDAGKAKIYYAYGDSAISVTQDLQLGSVGLLNGSAITWSSSDPDTVSVSELEDGVNVYNAVVTQPEKGSVDKQVTLTATATDPDDPLKTATATFVITVKAVVNSTVENVKEDYNCVDVTYADGDDAQSITQDITLVENVLNGSTVTWQSSRPDLISTGGIVTRPDADAGSSDVVISAVISNNGATLTKVFSLRVIAAEPDENSDVAADKAALAIGYFEGDTADSITTHVVLPTIGERGSSISWQSDNTAVVATDGTVSRQSADTTVHLTATIHKDDVTDTSGFTLNVKATSEDDILKQILEDTDGLAIVFANGDSADAVTGDIGLRTEGANGCDIEWTSDQPGIVASSGDVFPADSDTQVSLTARVFKYSDTIGYSINRTASFTLNVKSGEVASIDLAADLEDVEIIYATGDSADSVTAAMYFAPAGETGTTITWESDNETYVTNTGRVTRPSPDEGDKVITVRATITNPTTGATKTKVFEIMVKKLTDQEAVTEAARDITIEDAIEFSEGDYWESVTSSFWVLLTGKNDTNISWSTNSPSVVDLGEYDSSGRQVASITRPSDEDRSVILTATISRGTCEAQKTFLLIVKNTADVKTTTREDTHKTISASLGDGQSPQAFAVLQTRLTTSGNQVTKVDTVVLDSDKMDELTSGIDPQGTPEERNVIVEFAQDETDPADEQTVEVPSDVVGMLADKNASLQINVGGTQIILDTDALQALNDQGSDLYLRVVPLTDEQRQAQVAAQARAGASGASMVGIPYTIETNYTGIPTTLILPIDGGITNPNNVCVYVQHSDGTVEILWGTVLYTDGQASGIQVTIDHFSTFQVIQLPDEDEGLTVVTKTDVKTASDIKPGRKKNKRR